MSTLPKTPPEIAAVCREHFGKYDQKRSKWSPPNRCDTCPLHVPCYAHHARPARTHEELSTSRTTYISEALVILRARP